MKLDCDLREQDSLLLGYGKHGKQAVEEEYSIRKSYKLQSEIIRDEAKLDQRNSGCCYKAGLRYDNCYGINPMQYCQELKAELISMGVKVYECSEVHTIQKSSLTTNL
jgi:glycine/D-amino acid oxidase-like deaminating enzyme